MISFAADRLQLEDLRARLDRWRHLLDLGRRHHEDDVRRRLFDRLEERIEGLLRETMDLVDDEDRVADLLTGANPRPSMMTSRTLSIPVLDAASISSTSMSRPCAISRHASHSPHGSASGPLRQFRQRARMRAIVVLPTPRGPAKTNDCAMRPAAIALRSVCVTPRCPMTSSNRWGRHFRART